MLNWRELEERAEQAQVQVAEAADSALLQMELEDLDIDQQPWRRWIATAFIQIGNKIDPEAGAAISDGEAA